MILHSKITPERPQITTDHTRSSQNHELGTDIFSLLFFVSARGQVNLLWYLTVESNGPTSNVKHCIKLTTRPGITRLLLKFLFVVGTANWRRSSLQLVWFSLAFPLDSFSRSCSNSFSRSMLTTIIAGNRFEISISIGYASRVI